MGPQIDGLPVSIRLRSKQDVVEAARAAAGHIHIDDTVRHLQVPQHGHAVLKVEASASEIIDGFGPDSKHPSWRINGKCFRVGLNNAARSFFGRMRTRSDSR